MNSGTLNKKIILLGILVLIIAGVAGYILFTRTSPSTSENPTGGNLFPFGTTTRPPGDALSTIDDSGTPILSEEEGTLVSSTSGNRLRQVTQYPVTNYFSGTLSQKIVEPKLNESTGVTSLVSRESTVNILRWNIKQSGILMDAELLPDAIIIKQKTNPFIQAAEELWFSNKGLSATYRSATLPQQTITSVTGSIPVSSTTLDYCTTNFTEKLGVGSKSPQVASLQKYINKKLGTTLTPDGSFGNKTLITLKDLQKELEVEETGVYDDATRTAITNDCARIVADFNSALRTPVALQTSLLPNNILEGAVSPDGTSLFTIIASENGVVGAIMKPDGTGRKNIFASPLTEWSAQWFAKDTIALTTKASHDVDGYLYFLNTTNGSLKKILGPIRGLTTLVSPEGKSVLYSTSTDTSLATKLYAPATGVTKNFPLTTLPKKCTWSSEIITYCGVPRRLSGTYPDDWYQGKNFFDDGVWEIDTVTTRTTNLVPSQEGLDVVSLQRSPDGSYLYFINYRDDTLWSYRIK